MAPPWLKQPLGCSFDHHLPDQQVQGTRRGELRVRNAEEATTGWSIRDAGFLCDLFLLAMGKIGELRKAGTGVLI